MTHENTANIKFVGTRNVTACVMLAVMTGSRISQSSVPDSLFSIIILVSKRADFTAFSLHMQQQFNVYTDYAIVIVVYSPSRGESFFR